ncbi:MAG: hypothetical protein CMK59_15370 [Proteobacteria bacterium]|nr:hypothetical protein [Pseudomonadota bacterium]
MGWKEHWILERQEITVQRTDGSESVELLKEIRFLKTKDVSIAAVRKHLSSGPTRPPLLLLHGFAQNRYTWHCSTRSPSAWFAARGFDVWNVELRGHGRSRLNGQIGAESFSNYVEDIKQVVRSLPDSAFWMGHSLGGAVLYGAAATMMPLRCRGIIGLGALFHFAGGNPYIYALCQLTHLLERSLLGNLQIKTRLGGQLLSKLYGLTDIAGYILPISGWWPGSIETELLKERLERGFDWTSFEVWKEMSRWATSQSFPYEQEWTKCSVPLLVILGDEDHLLTPQDGQVAFDLSPSTDKNLLLLNNFDHETHWGHLDITIGKKVAGFVWNPIVSWMNERS